MLELNIHYVDPEEDYKYIEQAYNLAKEENIGITRDREVVNVVLDNNDNVIATTFDAWDFETFEFDVVVSKKEQGKKIGTQLTDLAIERFEDYKLMNEDAIIKLFVVNDNMKKILEKRQSLDPAGEPRNNFVSVWNACRFWNELVTSNLVEFCTVTVFRTSGSNL